MRPRFNLSFIPAAFAMVVLAQMSGVGILPRARAEGGVALWTNQYIGQSAGAAIAVVLDSSENVLATGFADPFTFNHDVITIKYSNTGVPVWTNRYNGPAGFGDYGSGLAVDSNANVFVVGTSGLEPVNGPILEYVTIKYSAAGVPLWTSRYDSGQDSYSNDFGDPLIALDSTGNIFVTGTVTNGSGLELRIIKYSSDGAGIWTNRFADAYAKGIRIDSRDNVVVAGYGSRMGGYDDYLILKYSNAGTALWTNQFSGHNTFLSAGAMGVAVDSNDNILVTGWVDITGSRSDYVTLKYSGTGIPLWTNSYYSGARFGAYARAVAVDSSDNLIVTGEVRESTDSSVYSTIKYSRLGEPLWTNRFSGGPGTSAFSVVVDRSDNVIVSGSAGTIAYSPAGLVLWTDRSVITLSHQALAVDSSGNVFAAGLFANSGNGYVVVKYSAIPAARITMTIISDGSGGYFIRSSGPPNMSYRLQRSSAVIGPWLIISTNTAPASGLVEYHDTAPLAGQAFYRAIQ